MEKEANRHHALEASVFRCKELWNRKESFNKCSQHGETNHRAIYIDNVVVQSFEKFEPRHFLHHLELNEEDKELFS